MAVWVSIPYDTFDVGSSVVVPVLHACMPALPMRAAGYCLAAALTPLLVIVW